MSTQDTLQTAGQRIMIKSMTHKADYLPFRISPKGVMKTGLNYPHSRIFR